jgi:hypothetical protein
MTEFVCQYCNKQFSTKYILNNHQQTAKYCLELQSKTIKSDYECNDCGKIFSKKFSFDRHIQICKIKEEKDYNKELEIYKKTIENLRKNIIEYETEIEKYKYIEQLYLNLQTDYKNLVDTNNKSLEKLASKAIENIGAKTTINNSKNYIQNLIPLTDKYIQDQSKNLELKHVKGKAGSLAYFANENSFKDRVVCTDVARRTFIFKDENGIVVKDPKGVKITKKFIDNNKEILVRLFSQYALMYYEDNCPYEYKDKIEIDECLYAVQRGDVPSNAENYGKFERIFTTCFSKLVYTKENEENDEMNEQDFKVKIEEEKLNEIDEEFGIDPAILRQIEIQQYKSENIQFINPFESK